MFEKLKQIINDFFYKEIEVDQPEHVAKKETASSRIKENVQAPRLHSGKSSIEQQVAYQYPKRKARQFKFPLVDDDKSEGRKQTVRLTRDRAIQRPSQGLVKVETRHRPYNAKELDDVPAYTRKAKKKVEVKKTPKEEAQIKVDQVEEVPEEVEQAKTNISKEIPAYTTPEELDKVFSKRDGKNSAELVEPKIIKPKAQQKRSRENKNIEEVQIEENKAQTQIQVDNDQVQIEPKEVQFEKEKVETISQANKFITEEKTNLPEIDEDSTFDFDERQSIPHYLLDDMVDTEMTDDDWLIEQQILLEDAFTQFNIDATVVDVKQGPSITQFEIRPSKGVKVSKIRNLSDDLKLHLSAKEIRIEAPIPGKNTIGIEIPNLKAKTVHLQQLIETGDFESAASPLTIALGLTIDGTPLITNINKMPHGLIAGATGSGKSVCINTIILSILYKASHEDVKLLLIDPKMVELTPYNQIPHLIAPVITDVKAATKSLKWAVQEMEDRYQKFVELGVRNIDKYNEKITGMTDQSYEKMPYIVIIIDELADLMMMSPQEVEDAICRIAQKARACGIHLLLATQRPSVDVITGLIKANIPTRIAFSVSSQVDSRTMLDQSGAEKLLGKGDMLFLENGAKTLRLQGPFVSDEEIERVTDYLKEIAEPNYLFEEEQLMLIDQVSEEDELMSEVLEFVLTEQQASTSLLQRRFRIGYNRAARLIDSLEAKGLISGQNGSKPRDVLVTKEQIDFEQ